MNKFPWAEPCDIVIPLSNESLHEHLELRIALRSIAALAINVGNIYIISDSPPEWLNNVRVIPTSDRHAHNKDANIIDKLLSATALNDLSNQFIFWSDDQAALHKFRCQALYPIHNPRAKKDFSGKKIWHKRMRHTFDYLAGLGIFMNWNWDSHTPQIMNKVLFNNSMRTLDYASTPGFCINTLYFGLQHTIPRIKQQLVKITLEHAANLTALPEDKLFIGYNDHALQGNLGKLLLQRFPQPCRFEK